MSLLDRPNELLLSIAGNLRCESGINALVCTNHRLYCVLGAYIYQYYIQTSNHSALPWDAYNGLTNSFLKFIELGANVQATLHDGKRVTSLHLASQNGHLLIVEALIQCGAEVNAQTTLKLHLFTELSEVDMSTLHGFSLKMGQTS